jgi:PKD repeat protein
MNMNLRTIGASALLLFGLNVQTRAQDHLNCGIDDAMEQLFKDHPELREQTEQLISNSRQELSAFKANHPPTASSAPLFIIPVVFHIIHQYGSEDISDAQVQDQVNILNRDYRLLNADTSATSWPMKSLYTDTKIEFRLATKDPEGNCTNGIVHYYSHRTNQGDDQSKLDPWPREHYLNVWVVKTIGSAGVAGYAYYPSAVTGMGFTIDGILILSDYIGSIGSSSVLTSRALTHEIGHYLNLAHVWGSTNQPGVACGDDGIFDTPPSKGWSSCPALQPPLYMNRVVCSLPNDTVVENVENYMEYSYCSVMFTIDQAAAMQQTLISAISFRDNLGKYPNHVFTGTDTASLTANPYTFPSILSSLPTCKPEADFSANRYYICQGGTVIFTDHSWKAPVTSYSWSFPNGTPNSSTSANPTVTFSTWGWQDVTLTVTNNAGSGTTLKHNYIFVSPPWVDYFGTFSESFENSNFQNLYIVENMEDSYPVWAKTSTAGYTGSSSVWLNAKNSDKNLVDAFLTPSFNLSTCSNATLNFKYSCASMANMNSQITEKLKVWVSTNCGQTWNLRKTLGGATLCNAGYSADNYTPVSQNLWASCSVALTPADMMPNVRFRFEYTAGPYSNNIFIDDINIQATVGLSEVQNYFFDLNVYPNPSAGSSLVNIGYSLTSSEPITISLVDMLGREILVSRGELMAPGEHLVTIDTRAPGLEAGVYLVKISNGTSYETRKLILTNP